jgi:hypothetical protein
VSFDALIRARRAHPSLFLVACVLLAFVVRLAATPFDAPLNLDAFAYLLKATEIARGFFTPIGTHAIGWSLLLAPFVALVPHAPVMTQMNLARVVACAIGALGLVPLSAIVRETVDETTGAVAMVAYLFALQLVDVSVRAWSEPLHTLLLLTAVAGALVSRTRPAAGAAGAAAAGAAYWVHPTGLIVPVIALVIVGMRARRGTRLRSLAGCAAIAIVVAAPAGYQRARAFGSPLSFGQNNRLFADSSEDMWSEHLPIPTLRDYVARHTPGDIAYRLVLQGFANEIKDLGTYSLTLPVVPFALYGVWVALRRPGLRPVVGALGVFYAAWALPYYVLGTARHLAPALPLALIVAATGLVTLASHWSRPTIWITGALCLLAIGHSAAAGVQRHQQLHDRNRSGLEWGRWIATHVRGRVAIVEGQELVMMHVPDATVGGVDINTMYGPETGLSLIRPGHFPTLEAAVAWMRSAGATHVVIDYQYTFPPYFDRLRDAPPPSYLMERYATGPGSAWPVRVYEFRGSDRAITP